MLEYYGDTTYQMLPERPASDALHFACEFQLYDFAQRSPQHAQFVNEEYIRRQNVQQKPLEADLKLVCLKMLVGMYTPSLCLFENKKIQSFT